MDDHSFRLGDHGRYPARPDSESGMPPPPMKPNITLKDFKRAESHSGDSNMDADMVVSTIVVPWQEYEINLYLILNEMKLAPQLETVRQLLECPNPLLETLDKFCRYFFELQSGQDSDNPPENPATCDELARLPSEEYRKSYRIRALLVPSSEFIAKNGFVISLTFENGWFDLAQKLVLRATDDLSEFNFVLVDYNSGVHEGDPDAVTWSLEEREKWCKLPPF